MTVSNDGNNYCGEIECSSKLPLWTSLMGFVLDYYNFNHMIIFRRYVVFFHKIVFHICIIKRQNFVSSVSKKRYKSNVFINYQKVLPISAAPYQILKHQTLPHLWGDKWRCTPPKKAFARFASSLCSQYPHLARSQYAFDRNLAENFRWYVAE